MDKMKRTDERGEVWFKDKTEGGKDVWRRVTNNFVVKIVPAGSWDPES